MTGLAFATGLRQLNAQDRPALPVGRQISRIGLHNFRRSGPAALQETGRAPSIIRMCVSAAMPECGTTNIAFGRAICDPAAG
jgi:hypothetical protein